MNQVVVVSKLDKKSLKDYLIFSFTHRRWFKFFVVILVVAVFFIIATMITAFVKNEVGFSTFLPLIVLAVMFILYYGMFVIMVRSASKQNKDSSNITVKYLFTDAYMFINDVKDDIYKGVRFQYNKIFSVYENKKYFYIFVDQKRSYILPKDKFTKGSTSDLRDLLKKNIVCVYNQKCK